MAVAFIATPFLDGQIFANTFAGKYASMRLCLNPGTLNETNTRAQWEAVELSGNGYSRYEWTIPAGSFNPSTNRWEAPPRLCEFSASAGGNGLTWNAVVIVLGTFANNEFTPQSGISFLLPEPSNRTILAGASPGSYQITIHTDGFTVTS